MTLVTVTHPRFKRELRFCLESYRRFNPEPFRWALLTEAVNVAEIQAIAGDLAEVLPMDPEAEAVEAPYFRQMAAKLLAYRAASGPLVITDDDTEAVSAWSHETLFDGERARIWYRNTKLSFWSSGQVGIFSGLPKRDFQLLLPFAVHSETLRALAESRHGKRAMEGWHRREIISEFMVMGEFAWRNQERATFHDADREQHWTLGRNPAFRDWEGFRKAFKRRIATR